MDNEVPTLEDHSQIAAAINHAVKQGDVFPQVVHYDTHRYDSPVFGTYSNSNNDSGVSLLAELIRGSKNQPGIGQLFNGLEDNIWETPLESDAYYVDPRRLVETISAEWGNISMPYYTYRPGHYEGIEGQLDALVEHLSRTRPVVVFDLNIIADSTDEFEKEHNILDFNNLKKMRLWSKVIVNALIKAMNIDKGNVEPSANDVKEVLPSVLDENGLFSTERLNDNILGNTVVVVRHLDKEHRSVLEEDEVGFLFKEIKKNTDSAPDKPWLVVFEPEYRLDGAPSGSYANNYRLSKPSSYNFVPKELERPLSTIIRSRLMFTQVGWPIKVVCVDDVKTATLVAKEIANLGQKRFGVDNPVVVIDGADVGLETNMEDHHKVIIVDRADDLKDSEVMAITQGVLGGRVVFFLYHNREKAKRVLGAYKNVSETDPPHLLR